MWHAPSSDRIPKSCLNASSCRLWYPCPDKDRQFIVNKQFSIKSTLEYRFIMSSTGQQNRGFHFVHLTHPDDARLWKERVRSHAARNSLARQQRVIKHLNEKCEGAQLSNRFERDSIVMSGDSADITHRVPWIPKITTTINAARSDPFDTFIRKITKFENFLLDYCELQPFPCTLLCRLCE